MEDRITDLEMKISFQEQSIEELNQLLVEQQKQIDRLTADLKKILQEAEADRDEGIVDISLEVPPPHY